MEGVGAIDEEEEGEDDDGAGADLNAASTDERNDEDEIISGVAEGWGPGAEESVGKITRAARSAGA